MDCYYNTDLQLLTKSKTEDQHTSRFPGPWDNWPYTATTKTQRETQTEEDRERATDRDKDRMTDKDSETERERESV